MSKWSIKELGRLIEEVSERNRNTNCLDVYSVTNSQGFIPSKDYFNKKVFSKDISNYKLVHRGMFAYNPSRINVGSIAWLREKDCVAVSPLYVVFRINEDMVLQKWIEYFLRSDIGLAQICSLTSGSVRDTLKYSALERIEIPIAPITEQREMVKKLEDIDQAIKMCNRLMEKTEDLVKSRFIELFGGRSYPKVKASEVRDFITKGTTPPSKNILANESTETVPYIKVYNLSMTGELLFQQEPQYVSREVHAGKLARSKVYPNDVLMNIVGPPLGKFAIVSDDYPEWNINQAIAIFRAKEQILPKYLLAALMQEQVLKPFIDQAVGVRQLNISLEQCRNLECILPPIEEQQRFVNFVEQADKSKFAALLHRQISLKTALLSAMFSSYTNSDRQICKSLHRSPKRSSRRRRPIG